MSKLEAILREQYHVTPDAFAALVEQYGLARAASFIERHNALHALAQAFAGRSHG